MPSCSIPSLTGQEDMRTSDWNPSSQKPPPLQAPARSPGGSSCNADSFHSFFFFPFVAGKRELVIFADTESMIEQIEQLKRGTGDRHRVLSLNAILSAAWQQWV